MQGQSARYPEAVAKYQKVISAGDIAKVEPMVVANLCVCYILIKQNSKAEALIRKVEQRAGHAAVVNLVIGSLYCSKGNFDFGLSLMMKSLKPLPQKLAPDSWYYFKRCSLALVERLVRKRIAMETKLYDGLLIFLEDVANHGKHMQSGLARPGASVGAEAGGGGGPPSSAGRGNTVAEEADFLKKVLMRLQSGALKS